MTDNKDLIQELEVLGNSKIYPNGKKALFDAINLIKSQQEENDRLECVLLGVMHFVDKWLEGNELKQDEINRASAMREKTLQIVESKQAEIERLKKGWKADVIETQTAKTEAIKEFADEIQKEISIMLKEYYERKKEREFELEQASYSLIIDRTLQYYRGKIEVLDAINLLINTKLKEMAGDKL